MMLSVFTELRRVDGESAELTACGSGVLKVQSGPFGGRLFVIIRDGREHLLPLDTARALFGESAVLAVMDCAELEEA